MKSYNETRTGVFKNIGSIQLIWMEPDWFKYIPDRVEPFYFQTSDGLEICPQQFFFDGSSTPRITRVLKRFSPWYYAPVALVHDWLAETQACGNPIADLDKAIEIQQEAMKTMMEADHDFKSLLMFHASRIALRSNKARRLWNTQEEVCPVPIWRKKQRLKFG